MNPVNSSSGTAYPPGLFRCNLGLACKQILVTHCCINHENGHCWRCEKRIAKIAEHDKPRLTWFGRLRRLAH